ncbi:MAG TPA: N-acetylmuramoyl-L-alanine amidase [Bacilli bacterium]|nr:MAG: N-acetylmuramoyl-L-alanine amidase CwlH precursor [Tenericutes bacterium ADurb.BinA124]HNZ50478.1 N-acetylmuramoyl-L-alanine amidase [Bacilli bacterium]HPX84783.1 N-acetylmuramoyl-L-alanine amidase [Bacilli bacterium]HQC74880.1 N-acetylmuramoyl-L-alanine amidase [Bacilli bacterium]
MKKLIKMFSVLFLLMFLFACAEKPIEKAVLNVSTTALEMKIGETKTIETTVTNAVATTKLMFLSKNTEIATVDEQGQVTGISDGEATIIVYLDGEEDEFQVTVVVSKDYDFILNAIKKDLLSKVEPSARANITLPSTDEIYGATIAWKSSNEQVITNDGVVIQKEYDSQVQLSLTINYEGKVLSHSLPFTVIGYAYEIVADAFLEQFSPNITHSYDNIKTTNAAYPNAVITWSSSNELVFTNQGVYKNPKADTPFDIEVQVGFSNQPDVYTFTKQVIAKSVPPLTAIKNELLSKFETNVHMNIALPSTDEVYGSTITWESSDEQVITNDGVVFQKEYNSQVQLSFTIAYEGETLTHTIPLTVVGYAYEIVADDFLKQFNKLITRNYDNIKTVNYNYPNAVITWSSSNELVFTNLGVYKKPKENTPFEIEVQVGFTDQQAVHTFTKQVVAQGITIYEKTAIIEEKILNSLNLGKMITESLELPIFDEEFQADLTWVSNKAAIITSTGAVVTPIANQMVTLRCEVSIGNDYDSFSMEVEVAGKQYNDKWAAVEDFLSLIFHDRIKTQRYTMFGATSYTAYNYGYLPFYSEAKSVILDGMVPFADRPGIVKTETRWVVIHDTANTRVGADAKMHTAYIRTNPGVSWHYSVDDRETYQHIPDEEVAYHAGAREGNYYGIGIETCLNQGIDYNVVMRRTAKLTAELLMEFNLSIYNVRQHNYYSGKDCPHVMRSANRWDEFLMLVAIEYFALKNLSDVSFVWESLSPDILDNTGKIISQAGIETTVTYRVLVTYKNETREFTKTSTLEAKSW